MFGKVAQGRYNSGGFFHDQSDGLVALLLRSGPARLKRKGKWPKLMVSFA